MKLITSGENRIYKAAVQLKQKKYRDEQKKYLIEGPNLIREALQSGVDIELLILNEGFNMEELSGEGPEPAPAGISAHPDPARPAPAKAGVPTAVMLPGLFRKLSDTETPQGIMAIVKKRIYRSEEFFGRTAPSNVIVLDRLQDPGNIGTILRTADAAGYMGAVIMKGTADIYSPKIVRAAAGSLFRLPVLMADAPEQAIRLLKRYGKNIVCTAPGGGRLYYDADLRDHAAVVVGNEGNGVCDEFLEHSDVLVKIPMEGAVESLNAAVSAGILMYESVRRRYTEAPPD